jgi:prenyltransferase beta subunit
MDWINPEKLTEFILSAQVKSLYFSRVFVLLYFFSLTFKNTHPFDYQDLEDGGISDRPGDMVDVFHTHFGIAGLALLKYDGLRSIDPVYCMPQHVIDSLGLPRRHQHKRSNERRRSGLAKQ